MNTPNSDTTFHHTQKLKLELGALIEYLRADAGKVNDPKAQALFETSAEVITGLLKAFDDFEKRNEAAWKEA